MGGLARWCVHHKNLVLLSWITMLVALAGVVGVAGSAFSDSSRLPASDSSTAYNLLARAGSDAAKVTTGTIVWDTSSGSALSPAASARIAPMLASVAKVAGVKGVISPFTAAGARQVSADSRTAYATVVFTSDSHEAAVRKLAETAATGQLNVQVGGAAFTKINPGGVSEVVGVLAALVILLLVFRSIWAAALPIITGVAGVGVSSLAVILLSHVVTLPSVAPELGALIGLGVGIDYALFIVNPAPQGASARCRPVRRDRHSDEHLRAVCALRGRHGHRRAAGPDRPQRRLPDRAGRSRRGDRIPDRHGRGDPAPGAAGHDGTTRPA